ncbi:hypothetical protein KDD30_04940 [Photobacterium sp. GJ3]|uniref:hypothetical protein n=1 Tax=Photobacterium sp. GJ3 TaxID=2829502 RepID=UPI001B8D8E74|nr:hypothetical protein [Photobacterium sp. GJ3]QUJ68468.1 hypothetical protein KDD30_04940 [Photobacterium sp. GJ3]
MKKANGAYRLQIIKEVATKKRLESSDDPMANHIYHLLETRTHPDNPEQQLFNGNHFDDHAGGWISNYWSAK